MVPGGVRRSAAADRGRGRGQRFCAARRHVPVPGEPQQMPSTQVPVMQSAAAQKAALCLDLHKPGVYAWLGV